MKNKTKYTVGLLFNPQLTEVALIRKGADRGRQANKLNGIGGTVEEEKDGTGVAAFRKCHLREYKEETGYDYPDQIWHFFHRIETAKMEIAFFCGVGNIYACHTQPPEPGKEPEFVEINYVESLFASWKRGDLASDNLLWIIFLAIDCLQDGRPYIGATFYREGDTQAGFKHDDPEDRVIVHPGSMETIYNLEAKRDLCDKKAAYGNPDGNYRCRDHESIVGPGWVCLDALRYR